MLGENLRRAVAFESGNYARALGATKRGHEQITGTLDCVLLSERRRSVQRLRETILISDDYAEQQIIMMTLMIR